MITNRLPMNSLLFHPTFSNELKDITEVFEFTQNLSLYELKLPNSQCFFMVLKQLPKNCHVALKALKTFFG